MLKFVGVSVVFSANTVLADERLPWFGGEDQPTFKVAKDGHLAQADVMIALPTQMAGTCTIKSCIYAGSSTKVPVANGVSP
jgi:hypothetical protein